jgi:NAD(P)-dependent dehydrogenase (short-subunit alcohol dehydrogenase family)
MPTFVIVGAGTGLGLAAARRFGREGFDVALISRTQDNLDEVAATLAEEDITARGYAADVHDLDQLRAALDTAADELGPITALQYSPIPARRHLKPVLETDVDDLRDAFEFSVLGPATAIRQVLAGMRQAGGGSVLLVNGGTSVRPKPDYAGTSVAFAAESALGQMLHTRLADENIRVHQLVVPGAIQPGDHDTDPEVLADRLWRLHTQAGEFRTFATPMPEPR